MPTCAFPGSSILLRLGEEVTMATLPRVDLRHLSHWPSQWKRLHLPHSYPYVLFTGELVGGTIDRAATCDSARQPCDANVSNASLGYDVYPANGTRDAKSQLSSPVSSQRLSHGKSSGGYMTLQCSTPPHSKCDAPSQLFTPDSQPRHGGSNSSCG